MSVEIIAEIGINHAGSLEIAKDLIRMSKACGADYVKFQKRTVDVVYSPEMMSSPRESPWGKTQGDQKRGLEFGQEQYEEIDLFCKNVGIPWFASAWDLGALEFIESFLPPIHKVASAMLINRPFLEAVAKLKRKTLISTGMSDFCQIDKAVAVFRYHDCPFVLMHCISMYPCPDALCNIQMVKTLKKRYPDVELGYSGHEVGMTPSILAVAMGARWIERHVTLDRSSYGSDQAASLEKHGLELVVKYCREVNPVMGDGVKRVLEEEYKNARKLRYWEEA